MRTPLEIYDDYSHPDLEECLAGYAKASGQPMPDLILARFTRDGPGHQMLAKFKSETLLVAWDGSEWCLKRVVTAKEVGGGGD